MRATTSAVSNPRTRTDAVMSGFEELRTSYSAETTAPSWVRSVTFVLVAGHPNEAR